MPDKTREELVQEAIRLLERRNAMDGEGLRAAAKVNRRLFKEFDAPLVRDLPGAPRDGSRCIHINAVAPFTREEGLERMRRLDRWEANYRSGKRPVLGALVAIGIVILFYAALFMLP